MIKSALKKTAGLLILLAAANLFAGIAAEWKWDNGKVPGFSYDRKSIETLFPSEKAPDNSAVMTARYLNSFSKSASKSRLIFMKKTAITAGSRYRISFWVKASKKTELRAFCIVLEKPYTTVKRSARRITADQEWKKFDHQFTAEQDLDAKIAIPMIIPKEISEDTSLSFGTIVVEKLDSLLPLPELKKWTLFVKPGVKTAELEKLTEIPAELGNAKAKQIELGKTFYSVPGCSKDKEDAVFMTEFESGSDGMMQAGCAADWWFECIVNGKVEADTLAVGNGSHKFIPQDNVFNFPVRKGKNLIIVRVLSGSSGAKFNFGKVPFKKQVGPVEIVRSAEWRPVKMDKVHWNNRKLQPVRIDSNKIIPGTALDISQYLPKYDIDKLGFLKADEQGRLVASNDPSVRVKLYGTALFPAPHGHNLYKMTHEEIEELAEQIRLAGHSVLRLHFIDNYLMGFGGWPFKKRPPRKSRDDVKVPTRTEDLPVDAKALDRIDYLTKCLRDRGIYILLDIRSSTFSWSGESYNKKPHDNFQYRVLIGDPEARENYTAVFQFFMNHVNPYTNKKLKDDPQFMGITVYNEPDHCFDDGGLKIFDRDWQKFRKEKNIPGDAAFNRKVLVADTPEGAAAREFLLQIIEDTNDFILKTIRESGFKGFANIYDMRVRLTEGFGRRNYSAMAMHIYWALPSQNKKLTLKDFKQKCYFRPWWKGKMDLVNQKSSITLDGNYIAQGAVTRVLGKPIFMPEYAHGNYNQFAQEGGISIGAYASLQDWDLLTAHRETVRLYYVPIQCSTEVAIDPVQFAGRILASMMWRRGDVKPAAKSVNIQVPESAVRSKNMLGRIGSGDDFLFMITRLGTSFDGVKRGDLEIIPEKYIGTREKSGWYITDEDRADQRAEMQRVFQLLKDSNYLPEGNRTDPERGIFESETGEILTDVRKRSIKVVTPRLESLCLKKGEKLAGKSLAVNSTTLPVTVSAISIDDGKPLDSSKRVLLLVQTMTVSEHTVFSNETFNAQIDEGHMQMLVRSGKFDITLTAVENKLPKLYALNSNGSREKELPLTLEDGKLRIRLDTTKFQYGTPFFELVY